MRTTGTIAAGHRQTAEAGMVAYEAGGNAIDAAIAALLASCVTEPCMSGLGGGGFALVRSNQEPPMVLDFFCQTPMQKKPVADLDFVPVTVQFEATSEVFHVGKGSVAVPGVVQGIFELHKRFGTLALNILAEPAIHFARTGAQVDWFQAYDFKLLEAIFKRSPEADPIYYRNGQRLAEGQTLKNDLLADYLLELITEGPATFYEGPLSRSVSNDFVAGGLLTPSDFENYSAEWRKALFLSWKECEIFTNPRPGRGGLVIQKSLEALNECGRYFEFGSSAYTANIVNCLQSGFRSAADAYTKWGSTTHISTTDAAGNAVSLSVSNGEGSGCFVSGTGIHLNNMLGEAALFPNGFHSWQPNSRVQSLMSPTILLGKEDNIVALGTGGAGRIPSVLVQVLRHLVVDRVSVSEAVERGRFYMHGETLELEPGVSAPDDFPSPLVRSNCWPEKNMFFGGVHASSLRNGKLESVGDARRNGSVADTSS